MKNRYRLISRGSRGGPFYCVDGSNGKRTSLGACSRDEAGQIVLAKNEVLRQTVLNLQIARAYPVIPRRLFVFFEPGRNHSYLPGCLAEEIGWPQGSIMSPDCDTLKWMLSIYTSD